jgi:hypothetical protein
MKHWPSLFLFVRDPTMFEPTNNAAEQTMRVVVRIRRQTQGTRSAWAFIRQAVYVKNFGGYFPSLVPSYYP